MKRLGSLVSILIFSLFLTPSVFAARPVCPPQTDGNAILIGNPNNCSCYYECDNGCPRLMTCLDGMYFCAAKGTCSYSFDPDCTFDCTVVGDSGASCTVPTEQCTPSGGGGGGGGGGGCTPDANFSDTGYAGYEQRYMCSSVYAYRCAANYYGTAVYDSVSGVFNGCTQCPSGGTSVAGNNATLAGCSTAPQPFEDKSCRYYIEAGVKKECGVDNSDGDYTKNIFCPSLGECATIWDCSEEDLAQHCLVGCPAGEYLADFSMFDSDAGEFSIWFGGYWMCTICPDGFTSDSGNHSGIGDCYIPAGTSGSDATGDWVYSANCPYEE